MSAPGSAREQVGDGPQAGGASGSAMPVVGVVKLSVFEKEAGGE